MRSVIFGLACLVSTCIASVGQGDSITFEYEAIEIGGIGSVAGTFVFDDSVADSLPTNNELGLFPGAGSWSGEIKGGTLDGANFDFRNLGVTVFNFSDPPLDSLNMSVGTSSVLISDVSGTAFSDDSLPQDLDLKNFTSANLLINIEDIIGNEGPTGPQSVLYRLTSIQQVVPEPTQAMLLGIGAFVIGAKRRRRLSV